MLENGKFLAGARLEGWLVRSSGRSPIEVVAQRKVNLVVVISAQYLWVW